MKAIITELGSIAAERLRRSGPLYLVVAAVSLPCGGLSSCSSSHGFGGSRDERSPQPSVAYSQGVTVSMRLSIITPGGKLPFHVVTAQEIDLGAGDFPAHNKPVAHYIGNGLERIPVALNPEGLTGDEPLVLRFPQYGSTVTVDWERQGVGEWIRTNSDGTSTSLPVIADEQIFWHDPLYSQEVPFSDLDIAAAKAFPLIESPAAGLDPFTGRWAVNFEHDDHPAVGEFVADEHGRLTGTFQTALGDYRFLGGNHDGEQLWLSCFDGAHAFLFHAVLQEDGSLAGDFWSKDTWHETWTAVRDETAELADPFGLTTWTDAVELSSLTFPDLGGDERTLDDPAFAGKARLLVLFGSWCPNCNDEAPFLAELDRRYRAQGLSITALAFEFNRPRDEQLAQLRTWAEHHGVDYPILLAGPASKAEATRRFPLLDEVRAYPTTIFLDHEGRARAVHTGYAGPATGAAHEALQERFVSLIEDLLQEAP